MLSGNESIRAMSGGNGDVNSNNAPVMGCGKESL